MLPYGLPGLFTQIMKKRVGSKKRPSPTRPGRIKARTLVIGIQSDVLYPPAEQEYLHQNIPGAQLLMIASDFGHDGFLLEYDKIEKALSNFIEYKTSNNLKIVSH